MRNRGIGKSVLSVVAVGLTVGAVATACGGCDSDSEEDSYGEVTQAPASPAPLAPTPPADSGADESGPTTLPDAPLTSAAPVVEPTAKQAPAAPAAPRAPSAPAVPAIPAIPDP
jgi:hypothetical protein